MNRIVGLLVLLVLAFQLPAAEKSPLDVVQMATGSIIDQLAASPEIRGDSKKLNDVIDKLLLPHIDFKGLSRLAMGKHWRRANDQQKVRFESEFRILLIRTYGAVLSKYTNQHIEYLPSKSTGKADRATVSTRIVDATNPPVLVDYKLRKLNGAWKIYDVTIEGISMVVNYRTTFANEIEAKGIDGLIESLVARNGNDCSSQSYTVSTLNC